MIEQAMDKTTKCIFQFKCLDMHSDHPRCTADHMSAENRIVVSAAGADTCPYRMRFGGGYTCDCPTHAVLKSQEHPRTYNEPSSDRAGSTLKQSVEAVRTLPQTVDAAVAILIEELCMQDKAAIANTRTEEVGEATMGLADHIRTAFGLEAGNEALLQSCAQEAGSESVHPDDAAAAILARLVRELMKTHRLSTI